LNRLKTLLNFEQREILNAYLSLVEKCSPMVLSGITDTAENKQLTLSESDYDDLVYQAKQLMMTLIRNNSSKEEIYSLFQQLPDYSILADIFDNLYTGAYDESK
jgi:hypothetical protein